MGGMKVLAIDTALAACGIAIVRDGQTLWSERRVMGRGQAEVLLPLVKAAMASAGLAFADLDLIAVTVGTGSFTGIRTGIAAARGLALAAGKPIVGITTLDVLAAAAGPQAVPVVALIDAHRGEVYAGLAGSAPFASPLSDILAVLPPGRLALVGSGAPLVAVLAPDRCDVLDLASDPDPRVLARLGADRFAALGAAALPPAVPLYLRAPDAKLPAA